MADTTTTFVRMGDMSVPESSKSGHGTSVQRRPTLSGRDMVEKTINPNGTDRDHPDRWWANQERAHDISDQVRAIGNPAYDVPKTFVAHGKVREEFAPGTVLREIDPAIMEQHRPELIRAVGNLINDMSEMHPTQLRNPDSHLFPMWGNGSVDVSRHLTKKLDGVVSDADIQTIVAAHAFLDNLPEAQEMVFSHNDLHPGNIIMDPETGRVSIIDFELAGYRPKLAIMYHPTLSLGDLWNYVNHLPRTTNPDLTWNFDKNKAEVFRLLATIARDVMRFSPITTSATDTKKFADATARHCQSLRFYIGAIRAQEMMDAITEKPRTLPAVMHTDDAHGK
ncbi:aminoglycoside phosphotransferase family protein [bacterium]|nr:aminoglycoside phosphotransferase family protein [bacterium]